MPKLRVHRKGYTIKHGKGHGTRVKPANFKVKDRGKPGRTPKSEQFYHPKTHMGWKKSQAASTRRSKALHAHKGNKLAAGRALQALANVTTDRATATKARADAKYFFRKNAAGK